MRETADQKIPGASATAIQFHYDVSDDFYRLWLDPAMVYSCALWLGGDEDLAMAQMNKLDWHLRHSGVSAGGRLLEVGCGWGALLERAVNHVGVAHATGLTLSRTQADSIRSRNLSGVDVRLESWFDHRPEQAYDGIVSIGAFEHFARLDQSEAEKLEGYRAFFQFCHRSLRPGGCLSLQTVSYENSDRTKFSKFIEQQIFPETDIPHLDEIAKAIRGTFEFLTLRNDREHYARTLRCWLANLRDRREEAERLVGPETVAAYEKYLGVMVVAFHTGTVNLTRIAMRRVGGSKG